MSVPRVGAFDGYWAADAEFENCGGTRRFWRRELHVYAAAGHTIESFGRKLSCSTCRERGSAHRNVTLILRPVESVKGAA